MSTQREPKLRPRMQQAVTELEGLVRQRYPEATFRVARSPEDPRIVYLVTTVDVSDTTEVVDAVLDRVLALQIEEKLPIHVIPMSGCWRCCGKREHASQGAIHRHPRPDAGASIASLPQTGARRCS